MSMDGQRDMDGQCIEDASGTDERSTARECHEDGRRKDHGTRLGTPLPIPSPSRV